MLQVLDYFFPFGPPDDTLDHCLLIDTLMLSHIIQKNPIIAAIAIIVAVLIQPSNPDGGNNVITGKNESYFGANKGDTKEGRLHRLIVALSITILVASIIYFVLIGIVHGA